MKLTEPQWLELSRLYEGRQLTYGSARARVQRALYRAGLVTFGNENGTPTQTIEEADRCFITDKGREVLNKERHRRSKVTL